MKILFQTYYENRARPLDRRNCSSIKKCGLRLVHEQDVEQLNQIMMMNQAINISITASPRNSADASASGSSQQKSLRCKKSYALAKGKSPPSVSQHYLYFYAAMYIHFAVM
ncbi:TMV resistance protein N-like [Prunus yedoensis var. nudiflora]|uniref:TMV resistance protein N-like n=1 Tax=Prunus yedoensis var. nudiflora TaxID=2094558 RepID=A0A314XP40_PRUYE|nr:TMV resistance protein N-like [Prunus yedoensis var. nudiflora]